MVEASEFTSGVGAWTILRVQNVKAFRHGRYRNEASSFLHKY
ncbi:hypothetical protein HNQ34_001635 [Anoxybacillus tepidamans]|uniref:Uncharacterized protein n=1 Tax=Anoxybacteroides tepidamans TaxID=265948 RepID=A0A7W8MV52_9BACL|nr:hypothetical protein [Anoxybacillus tepidamans]MBB5324538.1 hypothetical protein [Anoxybacillus tepidamans]